MESKIQRAERQREEKLRQARDLAQGKRDKTQSRVPNTAVVRRQRQVAQESAARLKAQRKAERAALEAEREVALQPIREMHATKAEEARIEALSRKAERAERFIRERADRRTEAMNREAAFAAEEAAKATYEGFVAEGKEESAKIAFEEWAQATVRADFYRPQIFASVAPAPRPKQIAEKPVSDARSTYAFKAGANPSLLEKTISEKLEEARPSFPDWKIAEISRAAKNATVDERKRFIEKATSLQFLAEAFAVDAQTVEERGKSLLSSAKRASTMGVKDMTKARRERADFWAWLSEDPLRKQAFYALGLRLPPARHCAEARSFLKELPGIQEMVAIQAEADRLHILAREERERFIQSKKDIGKFLGAFSVAATETWKLAEHRRRQAEFLAQQKRQNEEKAAARAAARQEREAELLRQQQLLARKQKAIAEAKALLGL